MSRSYRKVPVRNWANAGSMKAWRSSYNRVHRHNQKQLIIKHLTEDSWDEFIPRVILDDSNVYDSPLDGGSGWWIKPHEEASYDPYTKEYSKTWRTVKEWKKVFRK